MEEYLILIDDTGEEIPVELCMDEGDWVLIHLATYPYIMERGPTKGSIEDWMQDNYNEILFRTKKMDS